MIKRKSIVVILIIAITVIFITVPYEVLAISSATQSGTISPTPSSTVIDNLKKIQNLKEKIATKVAEIRQKEKAGLFGIIKKIDNNQITVTSKNQDKSFTLTEDTIYYSLTDGSKKDSSLKNLKENDSITILGYYDEGKTVLSAKYIYIEKPNLHLTGKIADIDKTNYTLTLKDLRGSTLVDIENFTKMNIFSKEKGLVKIGFSKLDIGNTIHLIASQNAKEENRVTALRITTFNFNPPQTPTPTSAKEIATPSAAPKAKPTIL